LSEYQLIDFGAGRKLESLAGYIVDRPSPAAATLSRSAQRQVWTAADAVFQEAQKRWVLRRPWPTDIALDAGAFRLPFRATPFGHIGCFPEQLPNWQWLAERVAELQTTASAESPHGLNLFAHTGGSTLAMATAGARVTHVDAAKPSVTTARQIADLNGLSGRPIRYIVEDASRYVTRELRRQQQYDLIVLDPPSYGHGPGGRAWRIQRDLWPLVDDCLRLLRGPHSAMLITGHSAELDEHSIADYLRDQIQQRTPAARLQLTLGRSELIDLSGRRLDAGFYVRATW
jgi:23S rRNA (cytosine1962-C5)-methyltransferase